MFVTMFDVFLDIFGPKIIASRDGCVLLMHVICPCNLQTGSSQRCVSNLLSALPVLTRKPEGSKLRSQTLLPNKQEGRVFDASMVESS